MKRRLLNILAWTVIVLSFPIDGVVIWDMYEQAAWKASDEVEHGSMLKALERIEKRECS